MITEDYVSFEIAKLLKEKGFNEKTDYVFYYYEEDDGWCFEKLLDGDKFNENKMLRCPTLQMAMKWLREVHCIHIEVHLDSMDGRHPIYEALYSECINIRTNNFIDYGDTYEEVCEAAIKYCLTNLI